MSSLKQAEQEIEKLKRLKITCMAGTHHFLCIQRSSRCCLNCEDFDFCKSPCPDAEDWAITDKWCEFSDKSLKSWLDITDDSNLSKGGERPAST